MGDDKLVARLVDDDGSSTFRECRRCERGSLLTFFSTPRRTELSAADGAGPPLRAWRPISQLEDS